jgi:hypothetical protein
LPEAHHRTRHRRWPGPALWSASTLSCRRVMAKT